MAIHLYPFRNLFWLPENPDRALVEWVADLGIRTPEPHPNADQEEWTEAVLQAKAVIDTGYDVVLHIAIPRPFGGLVETPEDIIPIAGADCPDVLIRHGGVAYEEVTDMPDTRLSARYAELAAFEQLAGRKTILADAITHADPNAMSGYGSAMSRSGGAISMVEGLTEFKGRSCIVKITRPVKYTQNRHFDIGADASPDELYHMLLDSYDCELLRIEGDRDTVLIQEVVRMSHETRFFVAGGKVVSGAACIEAHTPLDRPAGCGILPPVFELGRNCGDKVHDEEIAARLVGFAETAAKLISAEEPELRNYVMDVAIGESGDPLLIELNPLVGSGLYANDPEVIVRALVADLIVRKEPEMAPAP